MPDNITRQTMSAALSAYFSNKLKVQLLQEYAEYLAENGLVDSKKECFKQVAPIISAAMDNGELTISSMEVLKNYIENEVSIKSKALKQASERDELALDCLKDVLKDTNPDNIQNINTQEAELLTRFRDIHKAYDEIKKALMKKYSEYAHITITTFIDKYRKFFNTQFLQKIGRTS